MKETTIKFSKKQNMHGTVPEIIIIVKKTCKLKEVSNSPWHRDMNIKSV